MVEKGTPTPQEGGQPEQPSSNQPSNNQPSSNWYDGYVAADPTRAESLSRYKSQDDFVNSWFEQRKMISNAVTAPDPTAENYLDEVKKARLKLGAKANPSEYEVKIPDDIEGLDREAFIKTVTERAAKFGVTQQELDQEVESSLEAFRKTQAEHAETVRSQEEAQAKAAKELDDALSRVWGGRKEAQLNNAILMARHYDDGLFAEENKSLSQEERAEKGGLLAQRLRKANDPMLWRLFAVLHNQILAESDPPRGGRPAYRPVPNVEVERYEEAKRRWPKRGHEYWDKYAKESRR